MKPQPLTRQRSPWLKVGELVLGQLVAERFERRVHDGTLQVLVGDEPTGLHLSISHSRPAGGPGRYPSWDEIMHARTELLPPDVGFVMVLPPQDEYVAVHDTCFHLHEDRRAS